MHKFEVWAPLAHSLAVRTGNSSHLMEQADGDWWRAEVEDAKAGTDYSFVVDDGDAVPDPRSAWQPEGVNGPSRVVDHSMFAWTDQNWRARPLSSAIIYELHVGTFTAEGTFKSAMERLDYLAELGITHVEVMPLNEFAGPWGWGYDGVDLYAPHHAYGTSDDLKKLIDTCHAKGLAVLLDVVYNHFGPAGNYLGGFGPYLTEAYKTPWGAAVNLDHEGSNEVRRFFIGNALMWLRDYHFDGLRLDAVHAFMDRSAVHFLEQLACEVDALAAQRGRHLVLIAESDLNDPRMVRSREAHGYGMNAQWNDEFHHALHSVLTGEQKGYYADFGLLAHLAKSLKRAYVYDGNYSPHRERVHGRPIAELPGDRFVVFSQNHDQIGNRARGERLSHLVSLGRQKIAAALVLTSPFVPMLFQGEEFGASSPFLYFSQHDPELGAKVSEGRKNEFGAFGWDPAEVPDPQEASTFERSKLDWNELREGPHAALLDWYKRLIALRRASGALTDSRLHVLDVKFDERAKWLVVNRDGIEIACNLGADRQAVPIRGTGKNVLPSAEGWQLRPGLIELPADSVAILSEEPLSTEQQLRQYATG